MGIFISYSKVDESLAFTIRTKLEEKGIPSFLAPKDIKGREQFKDKIKKSLRDCTELFLLVTPNSLKSEWVISEYGAAWILEKHIVPILFRCTPDTLPSMLADLQAKDFHEIDTIIHEFEERQKIRQDNLVASPTGGNLPLTGPVSGKIVEPSHTAVLSGKFSYLVELSNPNSNKFYYFVHEVDGQFWPKDRILPRADGKPISGYSHEGGGGMSQNDMFFVVLFEVDKVEHQRIQEWLQGPAWPRGIQIDGLQLNRIEVVFGHGN